MMFFNNRGLLGVCEGCDCTAVGLFDSLFFRFIRSPILGIFHFRFLSGSSVSEFVSFLRILGSYVLPFISFFDVSLLGSSGFSTDKLPSS